MTAKGALASNELTRALINIAARGERTHCSDPETHHYWLSEHDTERAIAITLCDHCPCSPSAATQPNNVMNVGECGAESTAQSDQDDERQHDRELSDALQRFEAETQAHATTARAVRSVVSGPEPPGRDSRGAIHADRDRLPRHRQGHRALAFLAEA